MSLKRFPIISIVATFILLLFAVPPAVALTPAPPYSDFARYSMVIEENCDEVDVYYPVLSNSNPASNLPVVLLLQGTDVNKSFYFQYASQVAQYGFVVAVPNHWRITTNPRNGDLMRGFFPEVAQLSIVLDALEGENTEPLSPLLGKIDTEKLGLLGHSLGGATGLSAIADLCLPEICVDFFKRPSELMAGAFFGANLRNLQTGELVEINNDGIGVLLLHGDLDGRASQSDVENTFDNIATPPKALVNIAGVNHFGINDVNKPYGVIPDSNEQTLDQTMSIETIARWSGLFLRSTLLQDQDAWNYIFIIGEELDPNISSVEAVSGREYKFSKN
ncbi:MAG: alpha/beta hydrolase [Cyanobacteria bacterium P01_F01_bin.143]